MVHRGFTSIPLLIMSKQYFALIAASTLMLAACGGAAPTDDTTDTQGDVLLEDQTGSAGVDANSQAQVWKDADGTLLRYNADTKMLEGSVDGVTYVEVPGNMWKGADDNWYKIDETGAAMRSTDEGQTWEAVDSWESDGVSYSIQSGTVGMMGSDAAGTVPEGTDLGETDPEDAAAL